MTAALVSLALVFHPQVAPVSPSGSEGLNRPAALTQAAELVPQREEVPSWLLADANYAEPSQVTLSFDDMTLTSTESSEPVLSAGTDLPAPNASVDYVSLTLRERALAKLSELGAPPWVVGAFDCVGWAESKWQNVRSRTGDTGVLQINDVHWPELNRLGLDPWVPEHAAEFSWRLFTRAGWSFRDWTVKGLCGLR